MAGAEHAWAHPGAFPPVHLLLRCVPTGHTDSSFVHLLPPKCPTYQSTVGAEPGRSAGWLCASPLEVGLWPVAIPSIVTSEQRVYRPFVK